MTKLDNSIKVCSSDRTYRYTTSVQHQGKVIAFALNDRRQILYTILEMADDTDPEDTATDQPAKKNQADVTCWSDPPKLLQFSREIVEVGYGLIQPTRMPMIKTNGQIVEPNQAIAPTELDLIASSTARLSADAPFQVLSDGAFLYLFRQSVSKDQVESQIKGVPIVDQSLLLDRFVLVDETLERKQEVRYQRSRHKTEPAGDKDSLSTKDMNDNLFYEPTQEIKFVGRLSAGRFAVLRLPTQINTLKRWQFFVYNSTTEKIDSFNVEQAEDGLFDTRGSRSEALTNRSFGFEGRKIATGLAALMYFQQENAPSGYDNTSKPMKQNARVMLAVGTQASGTEKAEITVLDFAVSRAGQLTQLPTPTLTLARLIANTQQSDQLGAVLEQVDALQSAQRRLVGEMTVLNDRIAILQPDVDRQPLLERDRQDLELELTQLRTQQAQAQQQQRDAQENVLKNLTTNQYEIKVTTAKDLIQITAQPVFLTLIGDLGESQELPLGGQWGGTNTYTLNSEVGVPQQVRLRYTSSVDDPWLVAGLIINHATPQSTRTYTCEANRWLNNSDKREATLNVLGTNRAFSEGRRLLADRNNQLDLLNQSVNNKQTELSGKQQTIANINQIVAEYTACVDKRNTVQNKLNTIQSQLKQQQASALGDVQIAMPLVGIDADGLTLSGAVLGEFAWTNDTPLLFDSATGQVMLYFRGAKDQFFVLYYNTLTAKALFRLPTQTDYQFLNCIARSTDAVMDEITIAVSEAESPERCTVVLSNGTVSETWTAVPRETQAFADVLNGTANVATYLGEIATIGLNPSNPKAIDLTLIQTARQTLTPEGALLCGQQRFTLDQSMSLGQVQVNGTTEGTIAPTLIAAGSLITLQTEHSIERIGILAQAIPSDAWKPVQPLDPNQPASQLFASIEIVSATVHLLPSDSILQFNSTDGSVVTLKTLTAVTLGQNTLTVHLPEDAIAQAQSTGIRIQSSAGATLIQPKQLLQFLPYDYDRFYQNTLSDTHNTLIGSRLVMVSPPQPGQKLINATVKRSSETANCQWIALSPGKTINFNGTTPTPTLTDVAKLSQLEVKDSLTIETWVKPSLVKGTQSILSYAQPGKRGYALGLIALDNTAICLDGQTHIQLPEMTIDLSQGLTLEAWVYSDRVQRWGRIFDLSNPGFTDSIFLGRVGNPGFTDSIVLGRERDTNSLCFELWQGRNSVLVMSAPNVLTLQTWLHVAVTIAPTGIVQLYLNGEPLPNGKASCTLPQGRLTRTNNRIARDNNNGADSAQPFSGMLDELRIWTTARSTTEIAVNMNRRLSGTESNLYAYYWSDSKLPTDRQLRDRTPNQRHGTIVGTAITAPPALSLYTFYSQVVGRAVRATTSLPCGAWSHLAATFQQSYAMQLTSDDAVIDCGNGSTLNLTHDLTIEAFLQLGESIGNQGILSKGKLNLPSTEAQSYTTSYSLHMDIDGKLCFDFEQSNGERVAFKSVRSLERGRFHRIAVVRTINTKILDDDGKTVLMNPVQTFAVQFYINGEAIAADIPSCPGSEIGSNNQPLLIGQSAVSGGVALKGAISEVRLWNVKRLQADIGKPILGKEQGLMAWWQFEEKQGSSVQDAIGRNHGTVRGGYQWVFNSDPNAVSLLLYGNGKLLSTTAISNSSALTGNQLTLAATTTETAPTVFQGVLEDTRIWRVCRTEEQILDNLFRRLVGEREQLLAYYTYDPSNKNRLSDQSGRNNHLLFPEGSNLPYLVSDAPISNDMPQVRSALASIRTAYHDVIHSTPSVQEYADIQIDSDGNTIGIYKRCYSIIKSGEWQLITGFKVGNLVTEWVGQVQFDPQIIGYIEGAPPVPSENLTVASDYSGASSVEIISADSVTYTYNAEQLFSRAASLGATTKLGYQPEAFAGPSGIRVAKVGFLVGTKAQLDTSIARTSKYMRQASRTTSKLSKLTLEGRCETQIYNPAIGRRFVPHNVGFALVQSETADVFALRLQHNHALVSYSVMPNPDIPKDWNVITFPINPRYTKQGTLDGKIGLQPDVDFPSATAYASDVSYFKPETAYALKRQIQRQEERERSQYEQSEPTVKLFQNLPDLEKRNLVNTYVWTAAGGLFAETQQTMDVYQENVSTDFTVKASVGFSTSAEAFLTPAGAGGGFELSATLEFQSRTTATKSQESSTAFSLNVDLAVEKQIGEPTDSGRNQPGKVDAYRFMTFYLQPQGDHFEAFFNQVIDPIWLAQSSDASAIALRQAQTKGSGKKPPCWRVFHRVTYVSRILPPLPEPTLPPLERTLVTLPNINSNYELIKQLDPLVGNRKSSVADLSSAIEQVLQTKLPELLPHQSEIVKFMVNYYGLT